MAIVNAPLFSFRSSGQLAQSLVYGQWKGLNVVRSYTVPSNPQSSGQVTQRGYFSEAVDLWHSLGLDALDIEAWNRYANTAPSPRSGFNMFVAQYIDYRVSGLSAAALAMGFDGSIADSGAGQVDFSVEEDGSAVAVNFHWGYTPTSLINVAAGVETSNVWAAANVAVASDAIVYMQARILNVTPVEIGRTGIYRFGPTS